MFTSRKLCVVLGFLLTLFGVLGLFVPNGLIGTEGLIKTNTMHSLVHLITGGLFLYGAYLVKGSETTLVKIVGLVYLVLTVLGFMSKDTSILGLIEVNDMGKYLNTLLSVILLVVGFGKDEKVTA